MSTPMPTHSGQGRLLDLGPLVQGRQGVEGARLQSKPSSRGFPTVHARGRHAKGLCKLSHRQSELFAQPGHRLTRRPNAWLSAWQILG